MDDKQYEELLRPVWDYLAVSEPPSRSDAIFVFGGIDMLVPRYASKLWHEGFADIIVVSGSAGALTRRHFGEPEAVIFKREIIQSGVPADAILTESRATNTGQNVEFGMKAALRRIPQIGTVLLVAKPFIMRRCVATFSKQFPDVIAIPSPPPGRIVDFIDRDRREFGMRLVEELDRLGAYSAKGFISDVEIPLDVRASAEGLRQTFS